MSWLVWRQQRTQLLFGLGALALLSLLLVPTGLHMHSAFTNSGLARCLAAGPHADCSNLSGPFESRFSFLRGLAPLFLILPLLAGFFWGAPLVARDLELGTHRLIWTQGVGRLRWLTAKLAFTLTLTVAASLTYVALIDWWLGPLDHSTGDRFQPGIFDGQGIVPASYALFAVALGVAAGAILKRALPAMAATLLSFLAVRLLIAAVLRRHFAPPTRHDYVPLIGSDLNHPGAWIFRQQTTEAGHTVSPFTIGTTCPANKASTSKTLDHCIRAHHFRQIDVFQPASHYWLFQGIETAIFCGLALALLTITYWWVRERIN
jgi:hypothetical protein